MPKSDEWRQQLDERQQARQADEEHQRELHNVRRAHDEELERRQELRDAYAVLAELFATSPRSGSDEPARSRAAFVEELHRRVGLPRDRVAAVVDGIDAATRAVYGRGLYAAGLAADTPRAAGDPEAAGGTDG